MLNFSYHKKMYVNKLFSKLEVVKTEWSPIAFTGVGNNISDLPDSQLIRSQVMKL